MSKLYNRHEVACILADVFGDTCACNYNGIDEWLPQKCDFSDTCCPNPVGVACWEQYLKYREEQEHELGIQTKCPYYIDEKQFDKRERMSYDEFKEMYRRVFGLE